LPEPGEQGHSGFSARLAERAERVSVRAPSIEQRQTGIVEDRRNRVARLQHVRLALAVPGRERHAELARVHTVREARTKGRDLGIVRPYEKLTIRSARSVATLGRMGAVSRIVAVLLVLLCWAQPAWSAGVEIEIKERVGEPHTVEERELRERTRQALQPNLGKNRIQRIERTERIEPHNLIEPDLQPRLPRPRFKPEYKTPERSIRLNRFSLAGYEGRTKPSLRRLLGEPAFELRLVESAPTLSAVPTDTQLRRIQSSYVYVSSPADFKAIREAFIEKNPERLVLLRKSQRNIDAALRAPVTGPRVLHGLPADTAGAQRVYGRFGGDVPPEVWQSMRKSVAQTKAQVVPIEPALPERVRGIVVTQHSLDRYDQLGREGANPAERKPNHD